MTDFFTTRSSESIPIWPVHRDRLETWLGEQQRVTRDWVQANGFAADRNRVLSVPDGDGRLVGVVLGLGPESESGPRIWDFAGLPGLLPEGSFFFEVDWPSWVATRAALGWALGSYRFSRYRQFGEIARQVHLVAPDGCNFDYIRRASDAACLARDLINTSAEDMGPEELAAEAAALARRFDASFAQVVGDELLQQNLPAIHAVGRASTRAPRLIDINWGNPDAPRVTLVGKGVCFDSGGLDIKNAQGMALMKKDMGGGAHALALGQMIMDANLPVRLRVLVPAVDNSISGNAYRPGDVLDTRKGLTVEIGNTDAEGRIILCDALALADEDRPQLLIDLATLTGAARIALGPELPALYSNADSLADELLSQATELDDPLWRMPLWAPYDQELASKVADVNHIASNPMAGSIMAALFLNRFVTETRDWAHLDIFAWNPKERPGRPVGAEVQGIRALYGLIERRFGA